MMIVFLLRSLSTKFIHILCIFSKLMNYYCYCLGRTFRNTFDNHNSTVMNDESNHHDQNLGQRVTFLRLLFIISGTKKHPIIGSYSKKRKFSWRAICTEKQKSVSYWCTLLCTLWKDREKALCSSSL